MGREEILGRVRRALEGVSSPEELFAVTPPAERPRGEVFDQFAEYAADYKAKVVRCALEDLPTTVGMQLRERGTKRIIVPGDLPSDWLPDGIQPEIDESQDARTLDGFDGSITGCACAVAETGSLVLDGGTAQGRRAITLVPDHHVCVVFEDQIVDSIPEAVALLAASVRAGRPLTWISGPSATSDIELTRVEGVHGARKLDIIIVRGRDSGDDSV